MFTLFDSHLLQLRENLQPHVVDPGLKPGNISAFVDSPAAGSSLVSQWLAALPPGGAARPQPAAGGRHSPDPTQRLLVLVGDWSFPGKLCVQPLV